MKGVLLDQGSLHCDDLDLDSLQGQFAQWESFELTAPEQVIARLHNADIVLTNKTPLSRKTLARLPQLKLILVLATGTNNIDLDAAAEHGIAVCNNVGYSTQSLVEHTLALMLALSRQLPTYIEKVKQGDWQRANQFCLLDPPISSLHGKQLGIIGAGSSGRSLAAVTRALGMRTVALQSLIGSRSAEDPALPRLPLRPLLSESDVVSVHCPLTDHTRDLLDASALAHMKADALLINTARGGIVNETALAEALNHKRLGGAAVDVLTIEPPKSGNPLLKVTHPNFIITPHNAWGSRESRQALIDQSAEIVRRFQQGELMNCVNNPR